MAEGAQWLRSPNGDPFAAEDQWKAYAPDVVEELEAFFQVYSEAERKEAFKLRRCTLTASRRGQMSADFSLMTCLESGGGSGGKDKVVPLRRYEGGQQTHPPAGQPHPWYKRQSSNRDSGDWLNNDFFFKAFSQVMEDAGHRVSAPAHEIFDFRWNQDYRTAQESDPTVRAGVIYHVPVGWKKFALRVFGRFEGGNAWLSLDGRPGEWAVAYHGTQVEAMPAILNGGMKAGERQAYKDFVDKRTGEKIGTGIYCTPNLATAAEYSPCSEVEGRKMQFVFQCRVRPEAIKRIHEEVGRESGAYWLINDASDIRPYGVLVREVS